MGFKVGSHGGLAARLGMLAAAAGCGSTARSTAIAPPPQRETHAVLAGGLCDDGRCTCHGADGDGGAGVPADMAHKRFEIRLNSAYELWVTINKTEILYKDAERATSCFYVDLPTGAHELELRASNADGVSAGLEIHELGTRTLSWYDTFAFACGVPGVCSYDELDAAKARYAAARRNLFDRCGTTKVKAVSWDHSVAPDQQHPSEMTVRLTLDIYRFAAWRRHGDPDCEASSRKTGKPDEPVPPPGNP